MPLTLRTAFLALWVTFAGCHEPSPGALRSGPEAGHALAAAFEVSQVARAFAESVAKQLPEGCRPTLRCDGPAGWVQTELHLRRIDRRGVEEQMETRRWERDGSGALFFDVTRSEPAPQGGRATRKLTLIRVDGRRYGALDGQFLEAASAPLLDRRLEADPQAEVDALFDAAAQAAGQGPACGTNAATLPGQPREASVTKQERQRQLRILRALEAGSSLEIEVTETVGCDVEIRRPPEAKQPGVPADSVAALEDFLRRGMGSEWLLPPHPLPPARR